MIADFLRGTVEGNPAEVVNDFAKIEEGKPQALSFLANPKYEKYLYTTASSVVIVNESLHLEQPVTCTLIRVPDAYQAFASLLQLYESMKKPRTGVEQPSFISGEARLGKDVYVGAFAYIASGAQVGDKVQIYPQVYIGDGVLIGDRTVIYPGVKIYAGCVIGSDCVLHAGAVIGADGFGFAPQTGAEYAKIPQIGNVVIEDDVEIGANTCIDRATMGSTFVRKGVKLDNLIQLGHNTEVGAHTVIAAQTGMAGSSKVGSYCMIGGQVGIAGHIAIADQVRIGAQAGLNVSPPAGGAVIGSPAFDYREYMKSYVIFRNLPRLKRQLDALEKVIQERSDGK